MVLTEPVRMSVVDWNTSSSWFRVAVEVLRDFSSIVVSDTLDRVITLELRVSLDSESLEAIMSGIWNLSSFRSSSSSSTSFSFSLLKQEPSTSSSGKHCISWGLRGSNAGMEDMEAFLTWVALLTVENSTGDLLTLCSHSSALSSSNCLMPAGVSDPSSARCSYSRDDSTRVSEHSDTSTLPRCPELSDLTDRELRVEAAVMYCEAEVSAEE